MKTFKKVLEEKLSVLPSNNQSYGLYGEVAKYLKSDNDIRIVWEACFRYVKAITKAEDIDVRNYLDSGFGRKDIGDSIKPNSYIKGEEPEKKVTEWLKKIKVMKVAKAMVGRHVEQIAKNRNAFD